MKKMMKLLIVSTLLVASVVLASPAKRRDDDNDKCGAVTLDQVLAKKVVPPANFDVTCEICLDLVLIAETYAECEEAIVEHHMDEYCDSHIKNKALDFTCRLMINDIAHIVIEDTEASPTDVCKKIVHRECRYD